MEKEKKKTNQKKRALLSWEFLLGGWHVVGGCEWKGISKRKIMSVGGKERGFYIAIGCK